MAWLWLIMWYDFDLWLNHSTSGINYAVLCIQSHSYAIKLIGKPSKSYEECTSLLCILNWFLWAQRCEEMKKLQNALVMNWIWIYARSVCATASAVQQLLQCNSFCSYMNNNYDVYTWKNTWLCITTTTTHTCLRACASSCWGTAINITHHKQQHQNNMHKITVCIKLLDY